MLRYAFGAKGGKSCGFSKIIIRKKTQHIVIQKSVIPFRLWGTVLLFCLLVHSTVIAMENLGWDDFQNCPERHWLAIGCGLPPGGAMPVGGRRPLWPCFLLLWAISWQFSWKRREMRASLLKAQVCHTTVRVVVGIECHTVCKAASICLAQCRFSLSGNFLVVSLYLLSSSV